MRTLKRTSAAVLLLIAPLFFTADAVPARTNNVLEIRTGTVQLTELHSVSGVIVYPGAQLIVDGDADAGERLYCDGGSVHIGGSLTAERVWLDGTNAPAQLVVDGGVDCVFFTQRGGHTAINGVLTVSYGDYYDGLGLVNVVAQPWDAADDAFVVSGGVSAPDGTSYIGDAPNTDEALLASMYAVRR